MADAAAILENVARLRALFPEGFDPVMEALKAGVGSVRLRKSSLGIAAYYSPEENAIYLDPHADWGKIAGEVAGRFPWLGIDPENVKIFLYAHEISHARRRQHILGMAHRNLRQIRGSALHFMDRLAVSEEETLADDFARARFRKWKRGLKP